MKSKILLAVVALLGTIAILGAQVTNPPLGNVTSVGSSLSTTAGVLNTIQGIRTSDSPTFAGMTWNTGAANPVKLVTDVTYNAFCLNGATTVAACVGLFGVTSDNLFLNSQGGGGVYLRNGANSWAVLNSVGAWLWPAYTTAGVLVNDASGNVTTAVTVPIANGGTNAATFAARSVFGNATASTAAPAVTTTVDALAYQTAEIPAYVFVTGSFTTSGSGTALEAITGLTWTMPGSTALNIPFHCSLIYHQNAATAAVAFGFQDATTAPTQFNGAGTIFTNTTVVTQANLVGSATTTATAIVSATPSAITTNWNATLDGMIEQPSGTASVFTIRVSTATAADTVTVIRGSYCRIG